MHAHTVNSDGLDSVEEMLCSAIDIGLDSICFSEHCQKDFDRYAPLRSYEQAFDYQGQTGLPIRFFPAAELSLLFKNKYSRTRCHSIVIGEFNDMEKFLNTGTFTLKNILDHNLVPLLSHTKKLKKNIDNANLHYLISRYTFIEYGTDIIDNSKVFYKCSDAHSCSELADYTLVRSIDCSIAELFAPSNFISY